MKLNMILILLILLGMPLTSLAAYEYQSQFGSFGTAAGQFDSPRGVAVDLSGNFVITESGNDRVQICNGSGSCTAWGSFGVESGEFDRPRGVAVNSLGRIFIADRGNDRVQNCGTTGICTDFGGSGTAVGKFESPRGVAITADDRIVVSDTDNNRIQICTEQGVCNAFGGPGAGLGQFNSPAGVAVNSLGQIVIADRGNDRIQICTEQGSCTAFGSFGTGDGQFDTPAGVAVDSQDRIVVVDRFNHRVQLCDSQGNCVSFGSFGSGNGLFNLPWGVAVDGQNRIIVADLSNHRMQIFAEADALAIDSFTASPNPIQAGESVLLSWTVSNASQCTPLDGTPDWQAAVINTGSGSIDIQVDSAGDYLFTLQCTDGSNVVSRSVMVTVNFLINSGLNDAWVGADAPFQGFFFTVFPDLEFLFISWFTFDAVIPIGPDTADFGAFDQRWVTGGGFYTGNSVTINVELTSGGIFNDKVPLASQQPGYGTITIEFLNCGEALVTYNFPSVGLSGGMTLTRVLPDNIALCQVLGGQAP